MSANKLETEPGNTASSDATIELATHDNVDMTVQKRHTYSRVYRITKNFHDKKHLRNAVQQHFAKTSFAKGRSVNRHVYITENFAKKTFVVF